MKQDDWMCDELVVCMFTMNLTFNLFLKCNFKFVSWHKLFYTVFKMSTQNHQLSPLLNLKQSSKITLRFKFKIFRQTDNANDDRQ